MTVGRAPGGDGAELLDSVDALFRDPAAVEGPRHRGPAVGVPDRDAGLSVEDRPPSADVGSMDRAEPSPEPESEPDRSPMFSPDPAIRRAAVSRAASSGERAEDLGRVLVSDPDPEIRRMAMEALARDPRGVPFQLLRQALTDQSDAVRAAAVDAAASAGHAAIPLLISMVAGRRWPRAQARSFPVLVALLERPIGEPDLRSLLLHVAALEPPPGGEERLRFAAVARAVGRPRLEAALASEGSERLGAARLLLAVGDPAWLAPLAVMREDPIEELRQVAEVAARMTEDTLDRRPVAGRLGVEDEEEASTPELEPTDDELIEAVARGLRDPDGDVRAAAVAALSALRLEAVEWWATRVIESGSAASAEVAATAAEVMGLSGAVDALFERTLAEAGEVAAALRSALTSLDPDPRRLVDLAVATDPARRQDAVRLVWQSGGRAVLPPLMDLLRDPAGPVRMAVLQVLEESGDPAAADIAAEVLGSDSSPAVRATAIHLVARGTASLRLSALDLALADTDPDVRATGVEVLPSGIASDAAGVLLRAMADPEEQVWRAAARHLAGLPDREGAVVWAALRQSPAERREQLVRRMEDLDPRRLASLAAGHARSPDPRDRELAVEIAARAGDQAGAAIVLRALEDPEAAVRRTAAAALSSVRAPAGVAALRRALSDPQADVRLESVRALGLIDDEGVPPLLLQALRDPEKRVRQMAAEVLKRSRSQTVARLLAGSLSMADLRRTATEILEGMGQVAVGPLIAVATGDDAEAAAAAGTLLQRLAAPEQFVEGLASLDPDERLRSVDILGVLGGPSASDALLTMLSDPDHRVRLRAVGILGELEDPRAADPLRRTARTDPVAEVAAAAEEALRKLGGTTKA